MCGIPRSQNGRVKTTPRPAVGSINARSPPPSFPTGIAWSRRRYCRRPARSRTGLRRLPAYAGNAAGVRRELTARRGGGRSPCPRADLIRHRCRAELRRCARNPPRGRGRSASRTPRSGAVRPVRARQIISSPLRRAIAAPVAPVRACAFSAMMLMPGSRSSSPGFRLTNGRTPLGPWWRTRR